MAFAYSAMRGETLPWKSSETTSGLSGKASRTRRSTSVSGSHHRAVQRNQEPVDRLSLCAGDNTGHDFVEGIIRDRTRRCCPGHHGGQQRIAILGGALDEAAEFVMGILPHGEHGFAKGERSFFEAPTIGRLRCEGVRLMHDAADCDAHGKPRGKSLVFSQ